MPDTSVRTEEYASRLGSLEAKMETLEKQLPEISEEVKKIGKIIFNGHTDSIKEIKSMVTILCEESARHKGARKAVNWILKFVVTVLSILVALFTIGVI